MSADVYRSVWSTFERMWGLAMYGAVFMFVVMWSGAFRGVEGSRRALFYASTSVGMVSLYALIAWLVQGFPSRITGSIGNAAFLASFVMLGFFILLAYGAAQEMRRSRDKVLWVVSVAMTVMTLVLTGTRGSLLGFAAGVGAVLVLTSMGGARDAWLLQRGTLVRVAKGGIVVGILCAVAFFPLRPYLATSNVNILKRLGQISLENRAVSGRLLNWQIAWKGAWERPLFGWGPEQYHVLYDVHYDPQLYNIEPWVDRAHNAYLDTFAISGLVGLLSYLGVLVVGIYGGWRLHREHWAMGNAVIGGIIAYAVNAVFLFDTLWTWVLLLLLASLPYGLQSDTRVRVIARGQRMMRGVVLIAGGIVLVWYGVVVPMIANANAKIAYDALAEGNDTKAYAAYATALQRETYGSVDIDRSLAEYVFDFVRKGGKRDDASLVRVTEHALLAMDRNIAREPANGKWWLWAGQLASLYTTLTDENKVSMLSRSVTYLNGARERMPNRVQVYLELAQVYRMQGDVVRMRDVLEAGIAIWPEYPLPHANAAAQYIYARDVARENAELTWLREYSWNRTNIQGEEDRHSPERDMALIRDAYYAVGRYRDAVVMQRQVVALAEEGYARTQDTRGLVKVLQELAAIAARAGDKTEARRAALRVLELDAAQRPAVEAFLRSL